MLLTDGNCRRKQIFCLKEAWEMLGDVVDEDSIYREDAGDLGVLHGLGREDVVAHWLAHITRSP